MSAASSPSDSTLDAPAANAPRRWRRWTFALLLMAVVAAGVWFGVDYLRRNSPGNRAAAMLERREQLDETVWADEVESQRHEMPFAQLWDDLRSAAEPLAVLAKFPLASIAVGEPQSRPIGDATQLELGIRHTRFNAPRRDFTQQEFVTEVESFRAAGYVLRESEWHHSQFTPAGRDENGDEPASSVVSMTLHVERPETNERFIVRGNLHVTWKAEPPAAKDSPQQTPPVVDTVRVEDLYILARQGKPMFEPWLLEEAGPGEFASGHPILLYDLDGDGLSEILVPRWNRRYRHVDGKLRRDALFERPTQLWESAVVADLSGDGHADLAAVDKNGKLVLFRGDAAGRFPDAPTTCAEVAFTLPTPITAGDIDGDGDLDLFVGQYKLAYDEGQMPTPIYDANDGHPAFLLVNDGKGQFTDVTESAGLAKKRHRRTYSASLADLDEDGDLDLVVVSDYRGVDLYRNDGNGKFEDVTASWVDEPHTFGMGHTLADLDGDGHLDLYVIGMSSTTARRLESLKLSPAERADITRMRMTMGYGNRVYAGRVSDRFHFDTAQFQQELARTGWSWGVTSPDFDNDGDRDLYIANGHRSGKSARDYCTRFWCHDIYTGDSTPDPAVAKVFIESLEELNRREISWNGFEHNALLLNQRGLLDDLSRLYPMGDSYLPATFPNVGFLLGAGFEFDSRSVVSDDLDGDGRVDLILTESVFDGQGFATKLHVYRNTLEKPGHWIGVQLGESGPGRSPCGAKVRLKTDRGVQYSQVVTGDSFLAQHAPTVHFGLGNEPAAIETLEVTWPNGERTTLDSAEIDRYHSVMGRAAPASESPPPASGISSAAP